MRGRSEAVRIGAELIPVLLVLGCLGGTLALVVTMHRRNATSTRDREAKTVAVAPNPAPKPVPAVLPPPPAPAPPEPTPPPPEDPTPKLVARHAELAAEQRAEAAKADAKAASLASARRAAEAEADRWRRREMLVKARADELNALAGKLEAEAEALARERDVLAKRRDEEREELKKAQSRSQDSYAILPYKGANGTWQRPIAIECHDGVATIRPGGPTFSMMELAGGFGMRSSPIVAAVARELVRVRNEAGPDGAPSVPYILFVVRPSGIRSYYEARGRLERLGIAFGYELVDADADIEFPDLAEPSEWPGAPPGPAWPEAAPGGLAAGDDNPYVWPGQPQPGETSDGSRAALGRPGRLGGTADDARGTGGSLDLSRLADGPPIDYQADPRHVGSGSGRGTSREGLEANRTAGDPGGGGYRWPGSPASPPPLSRNRGGSGGSSGSSRPVGERVAAQGSARPGGGSAALPPLGAGRGSQPASMSRPTGSRAVAGSVRGGQGDGSLAVGPSFPGESGRTESPNLPSLQPVPGAGGALGTEGAGTPRMAVGPDADAVGSSEGVSADGHVEGSARPTTEGNGSLRQAGPPGAPIGGSENGGATPGQAAGGVKQSGDGSNRLEAIENAAGGIAGGNPSRATTGGTGAERSSNPPPTGSGSGGPGGIPGLSGTGSSAVQGLGIGLPSGGPPPSGLAMTGPIGLAGRGETPGDSGSRIDLVVDCGPEGVTIQPGGYRLSRQALESGDLLVRRLEAVAASERGRNPGGSTKPCLHFVVQPGAEGTFWKARQQTTFAGLDWPATLRVAEGARSGSFAGRLR